MPLGGAATALTFEINRLGRCSRTNGIGPDPQLHLRECSPWELRSD